jgi:VWFA-related protein
MLAPLFLVLLAAAARALVAQQPVFRSGIDLVTVDVTVLDEDGRPVEHLGPADFSVRVDGAPRRVVWAEYVPHQTSTRRAGAQPHFSSNEHVDPGRLILIAVDQAHIRRLEGRGALQAAARFIETLDPADRVAAAPLTHSGPIQFTDDHGSVQRYLERLAGESYTASEDFNIGLAEALAVADGSRARLDQVVLRECGQPLARIEDFRRREELEGLKDPCPVQVEQQARVIAQLARTQATLSIDALGRLVARLREIEGPKALVLLSEGLVAEPQLVDLTALGAAAQAARRPSRSCRRRSTPIGAYGRTAWRVWPEPPGARSFTSSAPTPIRSSRSPASCPGTTCWRSSPRGRIATAACIASRSRRAGRT